MQKSKITDKITHVLINVKETKKKRARINEFS